METVTFIGSINRGIEQNKTKIEKKWKKKLLREYEQLYKMTSGQWMHRYMFTAHPIYLLSMCLCNNNASIQCLSKAMNRISIYSTNCIWQFHYTNPNEGESVQTSPNYESSFNLLINLSCAYSVYSHFSQCFFALWFPIN